jgi:hypothetical protein
MRNEGLPSTPGDQNVVRGGGEDQDEGAGGHPLAQVDGADDSGPQGPQLLGPQVQRVPKFKIMKENGSRRVILADRRHKDTRGAWEYFADPGRAFDTCCFKAVAGDERLQHFCAEHWLSLQCIGRLVEGSAGGYVCGYCTRGLGRWKETDRPSFLDHKFLNCHGRTQAIQYTLVTVTVEDFWKNTSQLPEVTKGGVFRQMADSGEGAKCSKCIGKNVILCHRPGV